MLQFGLRLGARPQAIIATTPRPIPVLKQIIRQPGTVITRGTTFENRSNLAESFLSQVVSRYEGTRLGRQELSAEILDDIPGALWTRAVIDGRERLANCRKCRELSLRSILQVRADQDALPRRTADEAKDPASIATLGEFCPDRNSLCRISG
jgi:phage terminase large subunit-like protein